MAAAWPGAVRLVAVAGVPAALGLVEASGDPALTGWLAVALVAAGAALGSTRLLVTLAAAAVGGWAAVAAVYVRLHDPVRGWAPAGAALLGAVLVAAGLHVIARRREARLRDAERTARDLVHDAVTGLANREGLRRTGAHVLALAQRSRREASVLVVEVTSLRAVGPGRRHADEPALLRATGQVLGGAFRAADVVARVDAERFAVLLVGPTPGHVDGMVDRLRRRLDEHGIHVRTGTAFASTTPDAGTPGAASVDVLLAAAERAAQPPAALGLVPAPRTPEPVAASPQVADAVSAPRAS